MATCTSTAIFAGSASAATWTAGLPAPTPSCSAPSFGQPFSGLGDSELYTLAPGQSADNFAAAEWKLSGGAHLVTTILAHGAAGAVLDLPGGASAESPVMCVAANYPDARMLVRDLAGPPGQGVGFAVSYFGTPQLTGRAHVNPQGWSSSKTASVAPAATGGWQYVRFILTGDGSGSEYQVYNFYVDPRCIGA